MLRAMPMRTHFARLPHRTNLPLPRAADEPTAYMEHLELLITPEIPRALLVAGQRDAEVITMYS